jgi:hypothetical protein
MLCSAPRPDSPIFRADRGGANGRGGDRQRSALIGSTAEGRRTDSPYPRPPADDDQLLQALKRGSGRREREIEIGDEVGDILDAYRETHGVFAHACLLKLSGSELSVGS